MTKHTITIVKDFNPKPYGRYIADGDGCGELFRKNVLAPKLREYEKVHVNLDGYNRYGRSFIDEAFGGLIREENFSWSELQRKLTYSHSLVKSIETLIKERIDAARDAVESE